MAAKHTYDSLFPKNPLEPYLAWDGSLEEGKRLYLEEPGNYREYTGIDFDLAGIKVGSKITFHNRPKEMEYAIKCIAEDVATLVKRYGKKVILFNSGACPLGRKIRRAMGHTITDNYIKEKQKDFGFGQNALFGMIMEALKKLDIKTAESLVVHYDFTDEGHVKKITDHWANLLECGYVISVNENDSLSYREIEQEIVMKNGGVIWLEDIDPSELRKMEKEIAKHKVFSDNDGLQSVGCQAMSNLGIPTVALNMTAERGIRPRDYFTGGPFADYKVIGVVKDPSGLESQILLEEDLDDRSRGGAISKVKHCGEAVKGGVKQALVTQGNYIMFDKDFYRKGAGKREFRPIDAFMEGRFIGTRFVSK
jgi:hypothetical protein